MIRHNGIAINTRQRCIEHCGITVHFNPPTQGGPSRRFRLMHALLLAGPKTKKELAAIVYRDSDDGGPVTWGCCIDVQLFQLKGAFAELGLELRKAGSHTFRRYWLAPSPAAARAEAA